MQRTIEPELSEIRRFAEEIAGRRGEQTSGAHMLAALATRPGAVSDLLNERNLGARRVLDVYAEVAHQVPTESLKDLMARARDIAFRTGTRSVDSSHLLMALLGDTQGAARATLDACGADASRLRMAALNLGLGILGRRRSVGPQREPARRPAPPSAPSTAPTPAEAPAPAKQPTGVALPVMPLHPVRPNARYSKRAAPAVAAAEAVEAPSPAAPPISEPAPGADQGDAAFLRFGLPPRRFPVLHQIGKNLTLAAARGELDPVVGREREVEQVLDVLAKRQGNNPCLIGVAGVGKTSVVKGVALSIAQSEHTKTLDDRIIVEIPVGELLSGTGVRGALAGRLQALRKELKAGAGRVVLFFDEIHQLLGAEASEEIAADLKLAWARGELPCLGATTTEDYHRLMDKDPALARRFSAIEVEEPGREEAYLILEALAERLERHHQVRYQPEALALSIAWSLRYLPGRALPDKAVSIIDLAGARVRRRGKASVDAESVAEVVAGLADMPIERLLESDRERMLKMEEILAERIVGHEDHIIKIARILRRNAAGLGSNRPIGTFLLLGPTGVGKTETAKAIAEVLFHTESAMTRIDFSEYSEAHSVAKLIGAPPGYVGHESGGQLTEAVRRRPYQIVLLDEIEKAHPDVLTSFLAVFDEGRMTDGRGRFVDFTNTVILMTSNIGAREASAPQKRRLGFSSSDSAAGETEVDSRVVAAARAALAPELFNRIDEVLAFSPLERDDVREIARRLLARTAQQLQQQRGIRLEVDDTAVELLLERGGFDPSLGARPMKRTIARLLEAPLAERILRGDVQHGDLLLISGEHGNIEFDTVEAAAQEDSAAE